MTCILKSEHAKKKITKPKNERARAYKIFHFMAGGRGGRAGGIFPPKFDTVFGTIVSMAEMKLFKAKRGGTIVTKVERKLPKFLKF